MVGSNVQSKLSNLGFLDSWPIQTFDSYQWSFWRPKWRSHRPKSGKFMILSQFQGKALFINHLNQQSLPNKKGTFRTLGNFERILVHFTEPDCMWYTVCQCMSGFMEPRIKNSKLSLTWALGCPHVNLWKLIQTVNNAKQNYPAYGTHLTFCFIFKCTSWIPPIRTWLSGILGRYLFHSIATSSS